MSLPPRIGLALVALCTVLVGAAAYRSTTRLSETVAWVEYTHAVIEGVEAIFSGLQEMERAVRGHAIIGEEHPAEQFATAQAKLERALVEVRHLTADDPDQQRRLDQLTPLVAEKVRNMRDVLAASSAHGSAAGQALIRTQKGRHLMDAVRAILVEMTDEERRLLAEREAAMNVSAALQRRALAGAGGLVLALLGGVVYLVRRDARARERARAALEAAYDEVDQRVLQRTAELRDMATSLRHENAERVQAERTARAAEAWLREVIEQAPYSMQIFAPDGSLLQVNHAFEELWATTREAIHGYNLLRDPQVQGSSRAAVERAFAGETVHLDQQFYDPAAGERPGRTRWVGATLHPVCDESGRVREVVLMSYDVTAQRQAEQALRQSEERYRTISELASDYAYVFRVAPDGSLVNEWVTDSFARVVGLALPEIRARGGWSQFIHPDDWPATEGHIQRITDAGEDVCEFRFVTGTGEPRWVRNRARAARAPDGALRIAGAAQDVTERKQAELALRESQAMLQAFFDAGSASMDILEITADDDWVYVLANRRTEEFWGCAPGELSGRRGSALGVPEETRRRAVEELRCCLAAGGTMTTEIAMPAPDGEHWFLRSITPLGSVAPGRIAVVSVDITERKQAEAERDLLGRVLEASLNEIYMFDPETLRFRFVNHGARRNLGYSPEQLRGMTPLDLKPEFDESSFRELIRPLLRHAQPQRVFHTVHRRADGTLYPVEVHLQLVEHEGERVFLAVILDTTDRKRAEEERERLEAALRRSEILAAMGALVGGVAHEVRNPLFGITATLDAFEARFGARPEFAEYFSVLRREAERVGDLMRDLMEYGKPEGATLAPVPIGVVIGEAIDDCQLLAQRSHVEVAAIGVPSLPVRVDRVRLRLALQNLLQNAIQQSPPHGRVAVGASELRENGRTSVACTVSDCGPGFRAEDLPHVFDPFFSRRTGGTGLGLAIVQHITEQHGGTVTAANRPEGGAVVTLRLPLAQEKETPQMNTDEDR